MSEIKCPTCQLSKFTPEKKCLCDYRRANRHSTTPDLKLDQNKSTQVPLLNHNDTQQRLQHYKLNKQHSQKPPNLLQSQQQPQQSQQQPQQSQQQSRQNSQPKQSPLYYETFTSRVDHYRKQLNDLKFKGYTRPLPPSSISNKPADMASPIISGKSVYSGVDPVGLRPKNKTGDGLIAPPSLDLNDTQIRKHPLSSDVVSNQSVVEKRNLRQLQYRADCPCQDCQIVRLEKMDNEKLYNDDIIVSPPLSSTISGVGGVRDTVMDLIDYLSKYPDLVSKSQMDQLLASANKLSNSLSQYEINTLTGFDIFKKNPVPPLLTDETEQCPNSNCDHQLNGQEIKVPIYDQIDTIEKLISIGQSYHCQRNKLYNGISLKQMYGLVEPLQELQMMIGLDNCKAKIVDHIIFFLKQYHTNPDKKEMQHTVIYGPPGTGKTSFARILGKIYSKLGLVSKGHFTEVARTDLVVGYLGQSTTKTSDTIDKCLGGIMFIDEAYNLGHKDKRDSIAKECIDMLTQRLSEERDLLCIIAGYREEIDECFFNHNKGLKRRFPFIYEIDGYTNGELVKIFEHKMCQNGWAMEPGVVKKCEDKFNKDVFRYYGGDIESFVFRTKLLHARMNFYNQTQIISQKTLEESLKLFATDQKNRESKEDKKKREEEERDKRYEQLMYS